MTDMFTRGPAVSPMARDDLAIPKTTVTLADGRALMYFGAVPERPADYPDRRQLAPVPVQSQARWDRLLGEWVVIDRLFDGPAPYISAWHQAPVHRGADIFALHLELFTIRRAPGKLKYLAGSESGMGAFANDIAPETAADRLRRLGG